MIRKALYIWRWSIIFLLFTCISSCRVPYSILPYVEAKREFFGGNFSHAATLISDIEPSKMYERLMDNFNVALILQAAGNYKLSNAYFEFVSDLAENVEPITITESAGAWITNEQNFYYRLEDYERVLVHFFMAINYLALEQPSEALVEFRRLELLLEKYSKLRESKYDIIDAFRFLGAYCYFLTNNLSDTKIELKNIGREDFLEEFQKPFKLLIIIANGIAPKKVPDPSFPFFPKYVDNMYEYKNYNVLLNSQAINPIFSINIGELLKKGLENRLSQIKAKTLARLAAKGVTTIVTSQKHPVVGPAAGLALFGWEKPDLRSVETLPDNVRIFFLAAESITNPLTIEIMADKKYQKNQKIVEEKISFERKKSAKFFIKRLPF